MTKIVQNEWPKIATKSAKWPKMAEGVQNKWPKMARRAQN